MNSIVSVEKILKFAFPDFGRCRILLVGCGGTGSFVAQALARLAHRFISRAAKLDILFVDPDNVEPKNIGRQNFCPADIGHNKAKVLAERYNFAYGLEIAAQEVSFSRDFKLPWEGNFGEPLVVIGAVDTTSARAEIAQFVKKPGPIWWLDSGNAEFGGQVLLGNSVSCRNYVDRLGICQGIPFPSVQEPGLISKNNPFEKRQQLSCADLLARDEQSFFVNQTAAGIVANYLFQMLFLREINHFATYFDMLSGSARSVPITRSSLDGLARTSQKAA